MDAASRRRERLFFAQVTVSGKNQKQIRYRGLWPKSQQARGQEFIQSTSAQAISITPFLARRELSDRINRCCKNLMLPCSEEGEKP